jgi:hypothetical protein
MEKDGQPTNVSIKEFGTLKVGATNNQQAAEQRKWIGIDLNLASTAQIYFSAHLCKQADT